MVFETLVELFVGLYATALAFGWLKWPSEEAPARQWRAGLRRVLPFIGPTLIMVAVLRLSGVL